MTGMIRGAVPGICQEPATVLSNEPAGVYRHLVLAASGVARDAEPGHFVACAVGDSGLLLRRAFSLHRADAQDGTIEIVVYPQAPGTEWICGLRPGQTLDVVGPAGRPFATVGPDGGMDEPCVLVGGGYGAAPLGWLADRLRHRGAPVTIVVGAADESRLFGQHLPDAGVLGGTHVYTEDGSAGTRGRVTDRLAEIVAETGAGCVYACGPMGMLRAVHEVAAAAGIRSQLATEESMACGVGVCMTCVLPVVDDEGVTRMTRTCIDGPIFDGTRLRWDAIRPGGGAGVPADCHGAPTSGLPLTGHPPATATASMEEGTSR